MQWYPGGHPLEHLLNTAGPSQVLQRYQMQWQQQRSPCTCASLHLRAPCVHGWQRWQRSPVMLSLEASFQIMHAQHGKASRRVAEKVQGDVSWLCDGRRRAASNLRQLRCAKPAVCSVVTRMLNVSTAASLCPGPASHGVPHGCRRAAQRLRASAPRTLCHRYLQAIACIIRAVPQSALSYTCYQCAAAAALSAGCNSAPPRPFAAPSLLCCHGGAAAAAPAVLHRHMDAIRGPGGERRLELQRLLTGQQLEGVLEQRTAGVVVWAGLVPPASSGACKSKVCAAMPELRGHAAG